MGFERTRIPAGGTRLPGDGTVRSLAPAPSTRTGAVVATVADPGHSGQPVVAPLTGGDRGRIQRRAYDDDTSTERAGVDGFLEAQRLARRPPTPSGRSPADVDDRRRRARLAAHLIDSGRTEPDGERAAASSQRVLEQIEAGTRANQLATNPDAPLTHAVSGHGPGTDQRSRVLHGRRNDEIVASGGPGATPPSTVGHDPSNTSGAFSSSRAMLHTVTEGFAQANLLSAAADDTARQRGAGASRLDEGRFVTNVSGAETLGEVGYNLEVKGFHSQRSGAGLAADEIARRSRHVERTDGLQQARMVLDPAYVGGRRAGWNLQTAYANADPVTAQASNAGEMGTSVVALEADRDARQRDISTAKSAVEQAEAALAGHDETVRKRRENIERLTAAIAAAPAFADGLASLDAITARKQVVEKALEAFEPAGFGMWDEDFGGGGDEPSAEDLEEEARLTAELARLDAAERRAKDEASLVSERVGIEQLHQKRAALEGVLATKRAAVAQAEAAALTAARAAQQAAPPTVEREDGGGAGPGVAVYDAVLGQITGDRPSKPGGALKGTDDNGDPLTAHHLYPWNQIRDDLNAALASGSRPSLQRLLTFRSVEVESWFWEELTKPAPQRSYAFSEAVNAAAQKICWTPRNIFMGPLGEKRGDDPGEKLDLAYTRSGVPTSASAAAQLIAKTGGLGTTPRMIEAETTANFLRHVGVSSTGELDQQQQQDLAAKIKLDQGKRLLAERLLAHVADAQGDAPRAYSADEWAPDAEGKQVRQGRIDTPIHERSVRDAPIEQLIESLNRLSAKIAAEVRRQSEETARQLEKLLDER